MCMPATNSKNASTCTRTYPRPTCVYVHSISARSVMASRGTGSCAIARALAEPTAAAACIYACISVCAHACIYMYSAAAAGAAAVNVLHRPMRQRTEAPDGGRCSTAPAGQLAKRARNFLIIRVGFLTCICVHVCIHVHVRARGCARAAAG